MRATLLIIVLSMGCASKQPPDFVEVPDEQPQPDEPSETPVVADPPVEDPGPTMVEFQSLLEPALEPGIVKIQAILHEIYIQQPCGPDEDCPHCAPMMALRDPTLQSYGKRIHVQGVPEAHEQMNKLAPYTFVIEIREEGDVKGSSCEPAVLKLGLVECLDCGEDNMPNLSVEQLLEYNGPPGHVKLEAHLKSTYSPKPCPPKAKCQPCVGTTTFSNGKEGDELVTIVVTGQPILPEKLQKANKPYTFILKLGDEYADALGSTTCDPRFNVIEYHSCPDCPK